MAPQYVAARLVLVLFALVLAAAAAVQPPAASPVLSDASRPSTASSSSSYGPREPRACSVSQHHIRILHVSADGAEALLSMPGVFRDLYNGTLAAPAASSSALVGSSWYVSVCALMRLRDLGAAHVDFVESDASELYRRDVREPHTGTDPSNPFDFSVYHNYNALTRFLTDISTLFHDITLLSTIGQSVEGRELWVLEISDHPGVVEPGEPEFKYVGNMHGDEVVGREMLLRFIYQLCNDYRSGDPEALELVRHTRISIVPSMNPDGFERRRRENARGIDLNRNFPDQFTRRDGISFQPEVSAVMAWSHAHHFVISANLHGGALVANYPWDGTADFRSVYSASPDDAVFRQLALAYSKHNQPMYTSREFVNGITNGAAWYALYGGMQDWNYINTSDFELTLELSDIKWPPANMLAQFWLDNKASLRALIKEVHNGARGFVYDETSHNAILDAKIEVRTPTGRIDHSVPVDSVGWYYRPLVPGTYSIKASATGYLPREIDNVVVPTSGHVVVDFALTKVV